jgi:hypothetical protein
MMTEYAGISRWDRRGIWSRLSDALETFACRRLRYCPYFDGYQSGFTVGYRAGSRRDA